MLSFDYDKSKIAHTNNQQKVTAKVSTLTKVLAMKTLAIFELYLYDLEIPKGSNC